MKKINILKMIFGKGIIEMHRTRDKMTVGLTSTLSPSDEKYDNFRFFFFETDKPYDADEYNRIIKVYERNELDVLVHPTGGGGLHYLSPTIITKDLWKALMDVLSDVNPKCPMITLRTKCNKYVGEDQVWFKTSINYAGRMAEHFNSEELCAYLNHCWGSDFKSNGLHTELRFVNYPLPLERLEVDLS